MSIVAEVLGEVIDGGFGGGRVAGRSDFREE